LELGLKNADEVSSNAETRWDIAGFSNRIRW
jgi:hypothetical protein